MYYLTCTEDGLDYYSMDIMKLEEIKTMEYSEYDYSRDGLYHFHIGKFTRGRKYYQIGEATVLLKDCKCVYADIHLTM